MLEDAKIVEAVAQVVTVFLLGEHGQSKAVAPKTKEFEAEGWLMIDPTGGTSAEDGGPRWIAWQTARAAMLVAACAIAATAFLGGYLGPVLPGWLWLSLKTLAVMVAVVLLTHLVPRMPVARMLTLIWIVLLPIAFLDLLIAGLGAL